MIDGKMVSLLQGDSGFFCHLCIATRTEANILVEISQGFDINKDYNSCQEAWDKLVSGEISYSSKERHGQCHDTIIKSNLHFFSILHFRLRSLDFAQKVLYHLVSGQKQWEETGAVLRFISTAKAECIEHIRKSCGILMDTPSSNGGNTNCGPLAEKFFSQKFRDRICELIKNQEDRANYCEMLMNLDVMLRITQSVDDSKTVNVQVKKIKKAYIV